MSDPATASPAVSALDKPAGPKERSTESEAVAVAAATSSRVEVTSARSETTQVFAEPDGHLTFEATAVPHHVRRDNGEWAAVNLDLREASDGTLRPIASVADVRFSGGGTEDPLVTLVKDDHRLTIGWPGRLPEPELLGDAAKYAEVFPDVDLIVHATDTGFAHVLVVKTPQAAADSRVRQIRYDLGGDAAFQAREDGGLAAIAGDTVLAAATEAVMWDSQQRPAKQPAGGTARAQQQAVLDGADLDGSTAKAPGDAAAVAPVSVGIENEDLVLRPDAAMLAAPATAFPLYIDPAWSTGKKRWAYATNNNGNNTDVSVARVGKDPEGSRTYRSFFEFPTTFLKSKHVESAYVQMELDHSASCEETWTHMYATGSIASTPRTKWSPKLTTWLAATASRAPEGSGCDGKGDQVVNFPADVKAHPEVTNKLQSIAKNGTSTVTMGFCACNADGDYESSWDRWKKFFPSKAKLIVDYASPPGKPTKLKISGFTCPTSGYVSIGTAEPTLYAVYPDADVKDNQVISVKWEWVEVPANGSITDSTPRRTAPAGKTVPAGDGQTSNKLIGALKDHKYAVRTQAKDPKPYEISGSWSSWCFFKVDTTVPKPPELIVKASPTLPGTPATVTLNSTNKDVVKFAYGWDDTPLRTVNATGTTTKTATVSLTAPRYGGLTFYAYAIDVTQNEGNNAEVEFTVGRPSEAFARWKLETYPLVDAAKAMADANPAAKGDTPLQVEPGAADVTWAADAHLLGGTAASFDAGAGAPYGAAKAAVSLDTSKSFSVAAWLRLGDADKYRTAVSKDGTAMSVFRLQYRTDKKAWCFTLRAKDVEDAELAMACSASAVVGKWTHVAGVYDDAELKLKLYVDGVLVSDLTPPASWVSTWAGGWNATGSVVVGRATDSKYSGPLDYFRGEISDVQLFDRVLVAADLLGQRADDQNSNGVDEPGIMKPVQVGTWDFNAAGWCYEAGVPDTCGAPDGSAFDRPLTLTPGVQTGEGVQDGGLLLDGTHWATEPSPLAGTSTREYGYSQHNVAGQDAEPQLQDAAVLRTDQAFTVAAWVRLDDDTGTQTIVSQDGPGAGFSGFDLRYESSGSRYVFAMRNTAGATTQASWAAVAVDDPTQWHHVVAVFDPGLKQLRLHVDGGDPVDPAEPSDARHAVAPANVALVPWQAGGPLVVGRSDQPGGSTHWLSGSIDNVTAWQGAMTAAAIHTLYAGEAPQVDTEPAA
ncbi:LamG domain-containing protein [Nucisporomicrobium flavum]|uniref:LamG domain-containing protein n=1 Tax=Nucisporomicrobium flavum TaxID=2785915 RepID=UPI0018F5DDF8|nr:LamG domain-containing protein [Nucisporomicrobium flavum]